jgi:hypothetical protein
MASVEWILVTIVLVVPFALFAHDIAGMLAEYFTHLSWSLLLPFP